MNKPYGTLFLRLKVFEGSLFKTTAKIGKMSPFVQITWNESNWSSKIAKNMHISPIWEDFHTFESSELAPVIIKVLNHNFLLASQEIGSCEISSNDLLKGKTKEWVEIFSEGKVAGKIKLTLSLHEDHRVDLSTQNTSYANADLKEEYIRRRNELELEKEELEFYRMKYKKKQQKFSQDKNKYKLTVNEILKKNNYTEESSDEGIAFCQMSGPVLMNKLSIEGQKRVHKTLTNQVIVELEGMRWERDKKKMEMSGEIGDEKDSDTLELRFNAVNQFETPKRMVSPSEMKNYFTDGCSKSSKKFERELFN